MTRKAQTKSRLAHVGFRLNAPAGHPIDHRTARRVEKQNLHQLFEEALFELEEEQDLLEQEQDLLDPWLPQGIGT